MLSLQRSPSFLAYTYESDDEDEDQDCFSQLCGCQDTMSDDENCESPLCVDETTRLVPSKASKMAKARRNQIPDRRWFGTTLLALSVLVFCCEYFFLIWRSGENSGTANVLGTSAETTFLVPSASNDWKDATGTIRFSTTEYGEVWLIRHGEKDPVSRFDHPSKRQRSETLRSMYELSPKGWDRAHHLSELVQQGKWPPFSALFASRPATTKQALDAYPDFARDATGQSLVQREYQTLLPISEYLQSIRQNSNSNYKIEGNSTDYATSMIHSQFAKGEVEEAGLEIAKTAIRYARKWSQHEDIAGSNNVDETKKALGSPIVLVSWDHCSLPTLVVRGFGCQASSSTDSTSNRHQEDLRCYRCWSDDRFGDVLKLNVSLVTTTTITTVATKAIEYYTANKTSTRNTQTKKIVSHDYKVSSTILAMTGEAYPSDKYYKDPDHPNQSRSNSSSNSIHNTAAATGRTLSTETPMSIEKSTPCIRSYCTARPAAKHLVQCSCWNE